MTQDENGNVDNVMLQLDIELDSKRPLIEGYLGDGRVFFDEQLQLGNINPLVNPDGRQKQLMEEYAIGKYLWLNKPEHSTNSITKAENAIKTHIRAKLQKQTDDGIATGSNQFRKTASNVRTGFGL